MAKEGGDHMVKKISVSIFIFCMLLGVAGNASARLLATTGKGGDAQSTLYEVDQTTGALTLIGEVGYLVSGTDYFKGTLYGVTSAKDPSFHGLIIIDTTTGAGTPVGSGWVPGSFVNTVAEMAIDSSGNAYGWNESYPSGANQADDPIPIVLDSGTLGLSPGDTGLKTSAFGLAFDLSDNLHLINSDGNVYNIDTLTGASTLLGNLGVFFAHHGDVDPATGIYWGLGDPWENFSDLLSIDLSTQTVLTSVRTDKRLHTLAFATPVSKSTTMLYELKGKCKGGEWDLNIWVNGVLVDSFNCEEGEKIHESITLPTGPVELRSYGPDEMECGGYSSNGIFRKLKSECEYDEKVKAKFELKRKKGGHVDSEDD